MAAPHASAYFYENMASVLQAATHIAFLYKIAPRVEKQIRWKSLILAKNAEDQAVSKTGVLAATPITIKGRKEQARYSRTDRACSAVVINGANPLLPYFRLESAVEPAAPRY